MVLSTIAFTGMNVLIKYLTNFSPYQLVFFRSIGSLFFTFSFLFRHNISFVGKQPTLLLMRGIFGTLSMLLFFMAVYYMPLGSAVALRYTSPIFAAIFAILILKEQVKPIQWLFFIFSLLGVFVLKGFDALLPPIGFVLVLVSSMFSGLVFVLIRKLGAGEHPVVIINYFMCISTIVGGGLAVFYWKNPSLIEFMLLSILGVLGFFAQLFMTKAFQLGETSVIAPIKYIEVVFVIILSIGFFDESYSRWNFVGIAMIIGGLMVNIWYKKTVK